MYISLTLVKILFFFSNKYIEFGSKGCDEGRFNSPEFIHISSNNQLIVSDTKNHRIQIFDITNDDIQFISAFGSFGTRQGEFRNPKGVITDAEGYIMVADFGNNRLQLFEPDGSFVTIINDRNNCLDKSVLIDRPIGISILNGLIAISNWGRTQNIQIF